MSRSELLLGLLAVVLSLATVFVWIPLDVETGLVEKVRRSVRLGDAFAPTIAASIVGIGGLAILLGERLKTRGNDLKSQTAKCNDHVETDATSHIRFLAGLLSIITVSLLIMRYMGVVVVDWLMASEVSYRLLRDSAPWKYIGFFIGGSLLVTALISWVEHRFRWQHLVIGLCATLLMIALYDLPFEDLQLPPNADV
ncbi:MAG: hypothetical protein KTR32_11025 [Granulosicoccus sp.]|nr:hypothetical protein [Granulosicoccus sp.]